MADSFNDPTPAGQCSLSDGVTTVTFDLDPEGYSPIDGRRRGSIHRTIEGSTVYQDRGFSASDMVLNFTARFYSRDTLRAMFAMYKGSIPSGGFTFTDFYGNIFRVVFTPNTNAFAVKTIQGSKKAVEYNMSLSVVSVTKWFPYPDNTGGVF